MSAASPEEHKHDDTDSWGEGAPDEGDDGWGDDGADADGDWGDATDGEGDVVMPAAVSASTHSAAAQLVDGLLRCAVFDVS